jgi:hypothetical protein
METWIIEVRPLGGDSIFITLDKRSAPVAIVKAKVTKVNGTLVQAQEFYRVQERADGRAVREDDAEPELLKDADELQAGDVVTLSVRESK